MRDRIRTVIMYLNFNLNVPPLYMVGNTVVLFKIARLKDCEFLPLGMMAGMKDHDSVAVTLLSIPLFEF